MIVEFIEKGEFMTAWVVAAATHRLSVLAMNGRDMTVSQNRVLNSLEVPDPGDKKGRLVLLRATDEARKAQAEGLDLDELWEILEGEGDVFSFEALAALFYGAGPEADGASVMARAVFADGLKFRFTPEGAVRHSAEEVAGLIEARRLAEEAEQRLANMAEWISAAVRGSVPMEPDEGPEAVELLTDLALWGEKAAQRQQAKKILARAGLSPDEAGAVKALVALGVFDRHENLDLKRLGLPLTFDRTAEEAVAALASGASARRGGRLDLTSLTTLTIDSNGARDLDDAVSIKSLAGGRWQVGVHITDVADFIEVDSPLDLEARARCSSIYLPEAKYPMLPAELSEGLLSLTPGDVKPAFSFLATVEKDGAISDYSLSPSLVRVDRQLSFAEADQNLDEDSDLVDLWDLAQALIGWRMRQGGVNLNIPKLNVYFGADGSLAAGLTQWDTPSKTIVGELMILANYLAADMLHKNGWPCPYRFQEKPFPFKEGRHAPLPDGDGEDAVLAGSLCARRLTGRSGLSFTPAAHHGLGLPVYTAFTAPMRRYVDLLVGRQLRALAAGEDPAMDQQQFLRLSLPANDLAQRIQKMQNNRQRYWLNQFLQDKIGREFSAVIFEQNDRRVRACVTDYMIETELFLPKGDGGRAAPMLARRVPVKLVEAQADQAPKFEVMP